MADRTLLLSGLKYVIIHNFIPIKKWETIKDCNNGDQPGISKTSKELGILNSSEIL